MRPIGTEPNFVSNMPCVPEKLLKAAWQLFYSGHKFDYMDEVIRGYGSPGYVWTYPRSEHKVGKMIDQGYYDLGRQTWEFRGHHT
jgi:hypothetical protein